MSISAIACYGAIFVAAATPWVRGAAPERLGGMFNLAAALAVLWIQATWGTAEGQMLFLAVDGVLALGFLGLALRYTSLWLGGALLFQAAQFSLHAFYLVTHRPFDLVHAIANNVDSCGIAVCIVVGALATPVRSQGFAAA